MTTGQADSPDRTAHGAAVPWIQVSAHRRITDVQRPSGWWGKGLGRQSKSRWFTITHTVMVPSTANGGSDAKEAWGGGRRELW